MGGNFAYTVVPSAETVNVFNADNEMTSCGATALTYDADGQLRSGLPDSYTSDVRRHLKAISGSDTASFVYDALGRRMKKTVNGTTTQFLYDVLNPVQELNGSGAVIANMLTGLNIDEYFIRTEPSCCGPLSYLTDALGSTIELADSSGTSQDSYIYDPFGNGPGFCFGCAPTSNSYQFTGRENDLTASLTTSRLHYYRGRYYSPMYQRFISDDPIGFDGGDWNTYAYTGNDPTTFIDPRGLARCTYQIALHHLVCKSNDGSWELVAQQGLSSGFGPCENNPHCTLLKKVGPVPPDEYNIFPNTLPGRSGWWALQSQSWTPHISGLLCRLGLTRCGFNLHLGTYSEGCITFDKNDPAAVTNFKQLSKMLETDAPDNTLVAVP